MRVLPIGSLIKYGELDLLVVGYHLEKENDNTILNYSAVLWPVGYMNEQSIKIVKAREAVPQVEGYATDLSDVLGMFISSFTNEKNKFEKNLDNSIEQDEINLLPIGTVIKHRNFDNQSMIIGYYPVEADSETVYKYVGVSYPNGITKEMNMVMFNDVSIEQLLFIGYQNEFSEQVIGTLKEMYDSRDKSENMK